MSSRGTVDIIVIGAGLSGLTAARTLVGEGLEVLVLEARDRPGGRTLALEVDGVTVDLGGEWVDEAHLEMRNLVGGLGLKLIRRAPETETPRWFVEDRLSDDMPLDGNDSQVYQRMYEALSDMASDVDTETPWQRAPLEDDLSVATWLRDAGMSAAGIHAVDTVVSTCGSTVPLDRMSFYSYAVKVATRGGPDKGNEYRVEGGAGHVAKSIANELGERVKRSSPVTVVRQYPEEVEVQWVGEEGTEAARARRVILAVPFTCYPSIRFEPYPPIDVRRTMSAALYGVARKIAFIFDSPVEAPFTVTDTPLGYCWTSQPHGAARGILSFVGGNPLVGELDRTPEERKHRALQFLERIYEVPEPVAVIEQVWPLEYWTRGSYMIQGPGDMADFGSVLGSSFGKVHMAGAEGFAAAPSFMNSAVKSGLRASQQVMESFDRIA